MRCIGRRLAMSLVVLGAGLALSPAAARAGSSFCPYFVRGDADAGGSVGIADGLLTLNFLFAGGAVPPCLDAADADDSGDLDVADALYTFFYLYLEGRPPPLPGPDTCGQDATGEDPLGCESFPRCEPQSESRDFSGFASFHFELHGGLGFCPDVGQVHDLTITRQGEWGYSVELATVEAGQEGDPACLPGVFLHPCLVRVPREPRTLTPAEAARMAEILAGVEVFAERDSICNCIVIDPCVVSEFRWDGSSFSDFPCAAPRLASGGATAAFREFLESLKGAP